MVVNVVKRSGRKYFQAEWLDPITGRMRSKSTGSVRRREAEKFAAQLAVELDSGQGDDRLVTWDEFRAAWTEDVASHQAIRNLTLTVFGHVERIIDPHLLASIGPEQITQLKRRWRKEGLRVTSQQSYLRHLKAALNWAESEGMIRRAPRVTLPKGKPEPKGRPITAEEFERMLEVTPRVVGNENAAAYQRLQLGLWWSGLRLGEALALHWRGQTVRPVMDDPPMLQFSSAQKSREAEIVPMAPEFFELLATESDRSGYVFDLPDQSRLVVSVSATLSLIGEAAGVVVAEKGGKIKHASAHDFRRAFGVRWATRVMPAVLMKMMRHKSIETTMKFYALIDAREVASEVWKHAVVNTFAATTTSENALQIPSQSSSASSFQS